MTSVEFSGTTAGRPIPADFLLGAATAAYQVEGSSVANGRGRSIWDTFSHTPGAVRGGDTGDVAVDHYRRYREDVALMARLGLQAYRFSVSWPRIQAEGRGKPSQAGLDFYRRLVDELRSHDISPWLTLYHWDLPQALEDAGGWPARDTAYRFADYAAHVFEALHDVVDVWTTLNEPWCSAFLGYAQGSHAPGRQDPYSALKAVHHLLLGHGLAGAALRARRADAQIGITLNLYPVDPASSRAEDLDAARRIDGLHNRLFLDPLFRGEYPPDVVADLAGVGDLSFVKSDDLAVIRAPLDLLGINYYSRHTVSGRRHTGARSRAWVGSEFVESVPTGRPVTAMGWEVDATGLVDVLTRVHREYGPLPLYVTENGAAFDDVVQSDGSVDDEERRSYLAAHLGACLDAIDRGIPVSGYFVWSFMDNFEWAEGYSKRFGIMHVDFVTQQRRPKRSALWYADVIRARELQNVRTSGPPAGIPKTMNTYPGDDS